MYNEGIDIKIWVVGQPSDFDYIRGGLHVVSK